MSPRTVSEQIQQKTRAIKQTTQQKEDYEKDI